mmetsp:Transcript_32143/g.63993  ORF Transcript_32143/g.63993 Transcript_32143/m.63993 type:complete len:305 (+) Transcript_32143:92-1006(+)
MSESPTQPSSPSAPNLPPPLPLAVPAARPANEHDEGEEVSPVSNEGGTFRSSDIRERGGINDSHAILGTLQQLVTGQEQQNQLIKTLQKNILTARTMINEIIVTQNELKDELEAIKRSSSCEHCARKEAVFQARSNMTIVGQTTDEQIDAILENRKQRGLHPVKHGQLKAFATQEDLRKVRKHFSDRHLHLAVKIPKSENNKAGDRACILCSDSKVKRKTTWMCATCHVPLCNKILLNEEEGSKTHHDLWHMANDLLAQHAICHEQLIKSRGKKRERPDGDNNCGDIQQEMDITRENERDEEVN